MKNFKAILLLLLLAVLLLAANLAVRYGAAAEKASGRRVLVEDVRNVRGIRLERRNAPAVELARVGEQWRLRAPYSAGVDEQIVMKFLDVLAMSPVTDLISDSALLKLGRSRSDFSLLDPPLRVVLSDGAGERESIAFGITTPLAGGVYTSIEGMDSVFVVPSNVLSVVDVDAERFRKRTLFAVGPDAVASFEIKRRTGAPLEFSRQNSEWRLRDASASGQKVRDFLARLTSCEAIDFVWPVGASNETEHASSALLVGYGLDPDTAVTVSIKGVDGEDCRISLGKDDGRGHAYALVQGGTAIVTVPADLKETAGQDEGFFVDSRIFPVEAKSVASFSVTDDDVKYALVREKDGGWTIESPIVAKADDVVVDEMLARVLALSTSDLSFTGSGVAVSLATNAANSVVSRSSVFGKFAPENIRSKEIVRLDRSRVKRIVRIAGGGAKTSAVVYDRERKVWNVEEESADGVADAAGIDRILSAIDPLEAVRVAKLRVPAADLDDYGLDTPFLTVAIDQDADNAVRRNILLGKKTSGGRFATVGSSDAVFVIDDERIERLSAAIVGK